VAAGSGLPVAALGCAGAFPKWPARALGIYAAGSSHAVMENIIWFHNFLLWLITIITLFVLVLLRSWR